MARRMIMLQFMAALAACETTEGFVQDVENTTEAVINE
ncbi:entericidin A/B family lipoprotein [Roseovarius salis]